MKNLNEAKASLKAKIDVLVEEYEQIEISLKESKEIAAQEFDISYMVALMKEPESEKAKAYSDYMEGSKKARLADEIARYCETLSSDLMFIETRYIVIGQEESLISPAGFGKEDRVYLKTEVAIQSDRRPRNLSGVKGYDMDKIA